MGRCVCFKVAKSRTAGWLSLVEYRYRTVRESERILAGFARSRGFIVIPNWPKSWRHAIVGTYCCRAVARRALVL